MKYLNLYYVYDNINDVVISPIIPQSNDLAAATNFRDYYMSDEAKSKRINFKALDLVRFAQVNIGEDGDYFINTENLKFNEVMRFPGANILNFIKDEMREMGIDDNFVDEPKE